MAEPRIPKEVHEYYATRIREDDRIRDGIGELELLRTQAVVRRHLPPGPLRVLDVGGATGVHAEWLLAEGHQVHLVDPVDAHVEQALSVLGHNETFSASVGDGRSLGAHAEPYDVVLLFGPLYHLAVRDDRMVTWREAMRVVRPGGVVFAMAITRFASLFDGLASGYIFEDGFREIVDADLESGRHVNPEDRDGWFTTAYFHRPDELAAEAAEAGLNLREVVGVEGIAPWLSNLSDRWDDPEVRAAIVHSAAVIETEPTLLGLSPHFIAVAEKPAT